MFIVPNSIVSLENILSELKCRMANAVYKFYVQEEYSLKKCMEYSDFEKYSIYIELLERKLQNIKNQNNISDMNNPSITYYTDKNNIMDSELYLTECDNKLIHKINGLLK